MKRLLCMAVAVLTTAIGMAPLEAVGQPALVIKPLAQKKVLSLPADPLYWHIENFPSLSQAQQAAGNTELAVESGGKAWLFRLGTRGMPVAAGGTRVTEVGPVLMVTATEYLLRINEASGPPGSITSEHSHPGSESFYVVAGEQSIRSPHGVMRVRPGQSETGHGADVPMQVSSSGGGDLLALVMFVVDANKPFSTPAKLP